MWWRRRGRRSEIRRRFFHVARGGKRHAGERIELVTFRDVDPPQLQALVDRLFPNGISRHGDRYFLTPLLHDQYGNVALPKFIEAMIEVQWEYVRRADFPHRPSRMQSLFVWETLEEARRFQSRATGSSIFEVVSDVDREPFRADMNLLTIPPHSPLLGVFNAHRYWQGVSSGQPVWEILLPLPVTVLRRIG